MTNVKRVNLLPQAIHWRNAAHARQKGWGIAVGATLMMSALAWQWSSRHDGEVRRSDFRLSSVLSAVRVQKTLAGEVASRAARIESRLAVLNAMHGPPAWSPRITSIVNAVPPEMVLTRFNGVSHVVAAAADNDRRRPESDGGRREGLSSPETVEEVRLEGYALDHIDIATFLRRLKESGLFRRVDLERSVREQVESTVVLSFSITCTR